MNERRDAGCQRHADPFAAEWQTDGHGKCSGLPEAVKQVTDMHSPRATKFIQDGQLLILRNGNTYTANGQLLR
jgi:hypothetical protein